MALPFTSKAEMYLNIERYNEDYHQRMHLIVKYIFMFSVSLILLDHDALFIKPLIAYFNRFKIALYKLIFYLSVVLFLIITIFGIIIVVPFLITPYYQFKINYFINFLKLIPDAVIMMLILLITIRDNRKALSFLILILLVIITFVQEDSTNLVFSYLIPLSSSQVLNYHLGYYFVLIYILMLTFFYFLIFNYENI